MSQFSNQIKKLFLRNGKDVTYYKNSGTACPCYSVNGRYNPQWHRDNPTADECNGTGLIDVTTETITLRCLTYSPFASFGRITAPYRNLLPIGKLEVDDLIYYGGINKSTGEFVSLQSPVYYLDKLLIDEVYYRINKSFDAGFNSGEAEMALLKRQQ